MSHEIIRGNGARLRGDPKRILRARNSPAGVSGMLSPNQIVIKRAIQLDSVLSAQRTTDSVEWGTYHDALHQVLKYRPVRYVCSTLESSYGNDCHKLQGIQDLETAPLPNRAELIPENSHLGPLVLESLSFRPPQYTEYDWPNLIAEFTAWTADYFYPGADFEPTNPNDIHFAYVSAYRIWKGTEDLTGIVDVFSPMTDTNSWVGLGAVKKWSEIITHEFSSPVETEPDDIIAIDIWYESQTTFVWDSPNDMSDFDYLLADPEPGQYYIQAWTDPEDGTRFTYAADGGTLFGSPAPDDQPKYWCDVEMSFVNANAKVKKRSKYAVVIPGDSPWIPGNGATEIPLYATGEILELSETLRPVYNFSHTGLWYSSTITDVDDPITQPAAGDGLYAEKQGDASQFQRWRIAAPAVIGTATRSTTWVLAHCGPANGDATLSVKLQGSGGYEDAGTPQLLTTTPTWYSFDLTSSAYGPFVELTASGTAGSSTRVYVDAIYVDLYGDAEWSSAGATEDGYITMEHSPTQDEIQFFWRGEFAEVLMYQYAATSETVGGITWQKWARYVPVDTGDYYHPYDSDKAIGVWQPDAAETEFRLAGVESGYVNGKRWLDAYDGTQFPESITLKRLS